MRTILNQAFSINRLVLQGEGDDSNKVVVNKLSGNVDAIADFLKANVGNGKNVLAFGVHHTTPDDIQVVYVEGRNDLDDVKGQIPTKAVILDDGYDAANFLAALAHDVGVLNGNHGFAKDRHVGTIGTKLLGALFVDGKLKGSDTAALVLIGADEPRASVAFDARTGKQAVLDAAFDTDTYTTNTVVGAQALVEAGVQGNGLSPGCGRFKAITATSMRALIDDNTDGGTPAWTDIGSVDEALINLSPIDAELGSLHVGIATYGDADGRKHVAPIVFTVDGGAVTFVLAADKSIALDEDTSQFGSPVRVNDASVVFMDAYGPTHATVTVLHKNGFDGPTRAFFDGGYHQAAAN